MNLSCLIVDDEKTLTNMIAETLEAFDVFKSVVRAYDGADAMTKMNNQKFQIIILDLGMPKRGGLDVIKYIAENKLESKVIVISGGFTSENVSFAKKHTSHFLAKPFKINDLKAKIAVVVKELQEDKAATA